MTPDGGGSGGGTLASIIVPSLDSAASNLWRFTLTCGGVCARARVRVGVRLSLSVGKELADTLGYPIGLIDSSWGGTRDEAWMDPEARALCNATAGARGGGGGEGEDGAERAAGAAEGIISAGSIVGNNDDVIVSSNNAADNGDVAKYPWSHRNVGGNVGPNTASALWNSMVHPFLRTAIYGAIWYQGEADCTGGYPMGNHYSSVNYACTFPALISSWRKHWHVGSNGATNAVFPFGFMQLSTWGDKANSTCGDGGSASCDVAVVRIRRSTCDVI